MVTSGAGGLLSAADWQRTFSFVLEKGSENSSKNHISGNYDFAIRVQPLITFVI